MSLGKVYHRVKENKIEIGIGHDKNKAGKTAVEEGNPK